MMRLSRVLIAALCLAAGARAGLAADYRVTKVRVLPRAGHAADLKGGQIVGSLTSATNDFEGLVEIKDVLAEGKWLELDVPKDRVRAYRFLKFQARNDVHGDVAELEFYAGDRKLAGTPFGTSGSGEKEGDPGRAFDGDRETAFRGGGLYQ